MFLIAPSFQRCTSVSRIKFLPYRLESVVKRGNIGTMGRGNEVRRNHMLRTANANGSQNRHISGSGQSPLASNLKKTKHPTHAHMLPPGTSKNTGKTCVCCMPPQRGADINTTSITSIAKPLQKPWKTKQKQHFIKVGEGIIKCRTCRRLVGPRRIL